MWKFGGRRLGVRKFGVGKLDIQLLPNCLQTPNTKHLTPKLPNPPNSPALSLARLSASATFCAALPQPIAFGVERIKRIDKECHAKSKSLHPTHEAKSTLKRPTFPLPTPKLFYIMRYYRSSPTNPPADRSCPIIDIMQNSRTPTRIFRRRVQRKLDKIEIR